MAADRLAALKAECVVVVRQVVATAVQELFRRDNSVTNSRQMQSRDAP